MTMDEESRRPLGPSSEAPTPEFVARALSGEAQAFRELYELIAPSMYTWARLRLCALPGPQQEAEDLLQEVWLRAIEGISSFDPLQAGFRQWIFGIAKNVAYEMLRRRQASSPERAGTTASGSAALQSWPDVATSIHTRFARDESIQLLIDHVAAMEPLDRMLVTHCGFEGMPCAAAATRLGIGAEAATKRWQRLRARLRESRFANLLEP